MTTVLPVAGPVPVRTPQEIAALRSAKAAFIARLTEIRQGIFHGTGRLHKKMTVKAVIHQVDTPLDLDVVATEDLTIESRCVVIDTSTHVQLIVFREVKKTRVRFGLYIEDTDTLIIIDDRTVAEWVVSDEEHYLQKDVFKFEEIISNLERVFL